MRKDITSLLQWSVGNEQSILLDCAKAKWLLDELARLESCLVQANETIEYVAIGQKLECGVCGEFKPCKCDKS